jgi:hypothetical protein
MPVSQVAEEVSGTNIAKLAELAQKLKVYLCVGFIEKSDGRMKGSHRDQTDFFVFYFLTKKLEDNRSAVYFCDIMRVRGESFYVSGCSNES